MGLIRLLLAVAVVIDHSSPLFGFRWAHGWLAVEAFFMISGFYMKLILETKYPNTRDGRRLFWSNRFLRIYPSYWSVLALTIFLNVLNHSYAAYIHSNDALSVWATNGFLNGGRTIYLVLSNLFIVGLDFGYFVNFDRPLFDFTLTFWTSNLHAYQFDCIPQA